MIKLGVIFGSRSVEHDVSIVSGLQLLENVDRSMFDAFPIYISKEGEWFVGEPLRSVKTYQPFDPDMKGLNRVILAPVPGRNALYSATESTGGLFKKSAKIADIDCAILALHGMHGEDGTVQGLLELADIPYTSAGVIGSSVGMDKIVMKALFQGMGLPVLPAKYFYRSDWQDDPERVLYEASSLGFPLFVKPANLGSSIGISRATDKLSLRAAMDIAASYDRRIIVEKGVDHPREVNCACLGFGATCTASVCEQPISTDELLSFDKKYLENPAGKGMKSLARVVPAPIADEMTKRIQLMTCEIFRMLECKGVVRIDYMIDDAAQELYVNEINTIPGSLAYYLFEPLGISYKELINRMVEYAFMSYAQKKESVYAYDSDILKKAGFGTKGAKQS